jgi:DNA-binding transcriptional MerR regulator
MRFCLSAAIIGRTTLHELDFIKKAQGLGFSLDEVQEILRLSRKGEAPCSHVLDLAKRRLAAVEERITRLACWATSGWTRSRPKMSSK